MIAPGKTMRADEITIETAKTGKVTAAVAVMSIFYKRKCKSWSANPGNEKSSHQKAEISKFLGEIPTNQETFLRKQEKVNF
jgi:hypothetical protein